MIILTTDYEYCIPSDITGVKAENGFLSWNHSTDKNHVYYRVFKDGKQIASTVANNIMITDDSGNYCVFSVDKYGNCAFGLN